MMGVSEEKIFALADYASSDLYDEEEVLALRYADAMTLSELDVDDDLFAQLSQHYSQDAVIELTAVIAWENSSSKFNRALRIGSQGLWQRSKTG